MTYKGLGISAYSKKPTYQNLTIVKKRIALLFLSLVIFAGVAAAQKVGIKTNLVGDGFLSPNLGVEIGLAPKWTLDLTGEVNFWDINNHKWKHWLFQPEARYWFCDRFAGHFLAMHAIGGQYNFGHIKNGITFLGSRFKNLTDYRYQGWAAGAGIGYGYAWVLNKHWNLEAEIGIGWMYTRYDKYQCSDCGKKLESNRPHNYVGPTKLAISFEYIF